MKTPFVLIMAMAGMFVSLTTGFCSQYWAKTYGGTDWDYARYIQQTADGGYIIAGYTLSFGIDYDAWVVKLDNVGAVVWEKKYGGTSQDEAHYVQKTSDGGYIVRGCYDCRRADMSWFGSLTNTWLLKLNHAGEIIWQKVYPRMLDDVKQTHDGGYILAGGDDVSTSKIDVCVVKLDGDGTISWQQTYGSSTWWMYEKAYSIQQTSDDGYIVAGVSAIQGGRGGRLLIIKLDSNGTIIWQRMLTAGEAYAILQLQDNSGYILTGSANYGKVQVFNLDNDGYVVWFKEYSDTSYAYPFAIRQVPGIGYIIAGRYNDYFNTWDPMWQLLIDESGAIIRRNTCEYCTTNCIEQTIEGGFVTAGTTSFYGTGMGDVMVLNLDSNWDISHCDIKTSSDMTAEESFYGFQPGDCVQLPISESLADTAVTPLDTDAETSVVCCYDTEDNDNDCVVYAEDNCTGDFNPLQEDTYPPQGNGIGDACDCEGNFNCAADSDVDGSDAALFKGGFGRSSIEHPCIAGDTCKGDFSCDGDVDGTDASLFKSDFGRSSMQNPCPVCTAGVEWCVYP